MRIVVAMSGGVDSSTAAALLKEGGHEVIGIGLRFPMLNAGPSARGCCGLEGMEDARRVALKLGIPFYVLDYEQEFRRCVVDYFFESYAAGRTPNPCVECNRLIKFHHLRRYAETLGAERLATGHYARVAESGGRWRLLRGADRARDQSYFLACLSQEQLARALFPLGGMTKEETRREAKRFDLPVSEKPGSQDICFLGSGDYRAALAERYPGALREGEVVDMAGRVLARHHGTAGFTLGQRKGLGVAAGRRMYVTEISHETGRVTVGSPDDLQRDRLRAAEMNWIAFDPPPAEFEATVKARYRQADHPATVRPGPGNTAEVFFHKPQAAAAAGQSVVLYRGEEVLGGGIIQGAE